MFSLSVVLPVYNEAKSLEIVIKAWHDALTTRNIEHEFVVCEDGSTDGTKELVEKIAAKFPILSLSSLERRDYGSGVNRGIDGATKNFVLCIDSDGQCMPDSFDEVKERIKHADFVIGVRSPRKDPFIRRVYSGMFYALFCLLFGLTLNDPSCPYVLGRRKSFLALRGLTTFMSEGYWWGFCGAVKKSDYKITQVKIKHFARLDGSTAVFKLHKLPSIIFRNVVGIFYLKFFV